MDLDGDTDLALLRLPAKSGRPWLRLDPSPVAIGSRIQSRGFPRDHHIAKYPDGFPLDLSEITGTTTLIWQSRPVELLVLAGANADNGMSGAPAVAAESGLVVGVLRFSEAGNQRALAIPSRDALRRWPKLKTPDGSAPSYEDSVSSVPESLARSGWRKFKPESMHCVVVTSEAPVNAAPDDSLEGLLQDVLASKHADRVWKAFVRACHDRPLLLSKDPRVVPTDYSRRNVSLAAFNVNEALASHRSLEMAVRLIVEADLALFDLTGFQPAVMLLLGVRAATKRGVTINSHGGGWREGEPLNRPFNLSDLSLSSHSASPDALVGEDPRLGPLAVRLQTGFMQLARHPDYDDLPVYDSLRRLGPAEDASSSIPIEDEVLVLCSYDRTYSSHWTNLRSRLRRALANRGINTTIARLQDLPTPQLVSQSLYERIRRCVACVADWTGSSPSTFFELGVRLAVSPWNAVQIASHDWLEAPTGGTGESIPKQQLAQLNNLFSPIIYDGPIDTQLGSSIAEQLIQLRRTPGLTGHPVRQVAGEALRQVQERIPSVVTQLTRDADGLNHPARTRTNVPQALFYEVKEIKEDQERGAIDRRLAAWLFLEHVVKAGDLDDSDVNNRMWRALGDSVAADLFLSADPVDQDIALAITERMT